MAIGLRPCCEATTLSYKPSPRFLILALTHGTPLFCSKLQSQMQFYLLIPVLAILFGVYGEQQSSKALFKRGTGISGLYERQSSCPSEYFLCESGTTCCQTGTTCAGEGTCNAGVTTCTGSGEEVCGINCCESPLVCSESTLECVQGSSSHTGKNLIEFPC